MTKTFPSPLLSLILKENSFKFNGKDYLQTHGTAMRTKMAVAFANIFMTKIEREILRQSCKKPRVWKRHTDDVLSLCNTNKEEKEKFLEKVNTIHPTIKFMAEISETEITFLDTKVYKYKDKRFHKESTLHANALQKTETFQCTHQASRKALSKERH